MIKYLLTSLVMFYSISLFAQKYDAELLFQETGILVKNGKLYTKHYYEVRIHNRAGEKYTDIEIPYSKIIKVSNIEALIKNRHGDIVKRIKKSDISDRSAISDYSFYEDNFVKEFTLKHNEYPYDICYSYQVVQDEFVYIDYWVPVFDLDIPTRKAKLKLTLPKGYKIGYKSKFIERTIVDTLNGNNNYLWETSYVDLITKELDSPPLINLLPRVEVVPKKFKYCEIGENTSWKTIGNWELDLIKDLGDLPEDEVVRFKLQTDSIIDEVEKVKSLYSILQKETRYVNVSLKTGGLKPYPASYVSERKYGDCKALTNYFKTVLSEVGIKAYYTSVYSGSVIRPIDLTFPSQQFNHVFLFIPLKQDTLWVDCTSKMPISYLGTYTQGRNVFVIKKDSSFFVKTPYLSIQDVLEVRKIKFYPYGKDIKADFDNTYKGKIYELLFSVSESLNESQQQKYLRNYFIEPRFDILNLNILQAQKDSAKIQLQYSAKVNGEYNKYGNDVLVKILPLKKKSYETPENRKLPIQINYPTYKIDSMEYKMLDGYALTNFPDNIEVNSKYGSYKQEIHVSKDNVKLTRSFKLFRGNYSIDEYNDFFEFINKIELIEKDNYLVLTKSSL